MAIFGIVKLFLNLCDANNIIAENLLNFYNSFHQVSLSLIQIQQFKSLCRKKNNLKGAEYTTVLQTNCQIMVSGGRNIHAYA